jgi:hypothetical protein
MDISINGKPADIIPETEKTVGEILSGLETWLEGSGHRLSGLAVNGEPVGSTGMAAAFDLKLEDISSLDIRTSSWPELALEALSGAGEILRAWEGASFGDRPGIREIWEADAAARFLSGEIPDVSSLVSRTLAGEGSSPAELSTLIGERFREIADPRGEYARMESLVTAIAGRLEELPLDIQTGKDGRAAETVQLFSRGAEKLFRLLSFLRMDGLAADTLRMDGLPGQDFIEEFGAALKELSAAYEAKDAVLVGDLAEYELAPRLRKLYGALRDSAAVFEKASVI